MTSLNGLYLWINNEIITPDMKKLYILAAFCFQFIAFATAQINVMPYPSSVKTGDGKLRLSNYFSISVYPSKDSLLMNGANRLLQSLNRKTSTFFLQEYITPESNDVESACQITSGKPGNFQQGTDESYKLTITSNRITLDAQHSIGALRGMETILQLLSKDEQGFYFPLVDISDKPRFGWRGLMIDVARHFIPLDVLKRNIDAMAAVKLNVLHLHLTDDEGFRMESKVYPKLHQMGSNGNYYTQAEMKGLIEYARLRGIMVIPEFDLPGHSRSWFAGYPELASTPGVYEPGHRFIFNGTKPLPELIAMINSTATPTIDPSKEYTYQFLDKLIGEMSSIFTSACFHIGADENNGVAWKQNANIVAFMKKNNIPDTKALDHYFVMRMYAIIKKHKRTMVGWEELFNKNLPKDVIVQKWKPEVAMMGTPLKAETVIAQGNPVIISSGFYLDHHMPAHVYYLNSAIPKTDIADPAIKANLLGGEAAQWTEIADAENIEGRIWPGTAAIAERLWSAASVTDIDDMYRRLNILNLDLDEGGLQHFANQDKELRRLTGTQDISQVKQLTDVLTPVRGYKRLFGRMSKSNEETNAIAPLNEVADIVFVDSRKKREFRQQVGNYLKKDSLAEQAVRQQLRQWINEEQQWEAFKGNTALMAVSVHAHNLSVLSAAALEAMDMRKKGSMGEDWLAAKKELIKKASVAAGDVELAVIPELEALITGILKPEPAQYPLF